MNSNQLETALENKESTPSSSGTLPSTIFALQNGQAHTKLLRKTVSDLN